MRALLIEDGRSRGAVAAARGLGSDGWFVGIGCPPEHSFAAASRHVSSRHEVRSVADDPASFVDAVQRAIAGGGYDVVFGCGDAEVLALSAARAHLDAAFPYGDEGVVADSFDKLSLVGDAEAAGLRVPRIRPIGDGSLDDIRFPAIVKSRRHDACRIEAARVDDNEDARSAARAIEDGGGEALVQEMADGDLIAVTMLCDLGSDVVATVQQRALHIWPARAGVSARAVTVPVDPELASKCEAMLRAKRWVGLAEMQFIVTEEGPLLIDINGRFYGSLALAIAAGINFPALWAHIALGHEVAAGPADVGVRYQWLEGDFRLAMSRPHRLSRTVDALRFSRGAAHSVWDRHDVRPALVYSSDLVRRGVRKALRRSEG